MAYSQDYLEFVLEQLELFGEITYKKMFGGLMGGNFHLKVDDKIRPEFELAGMKSFFHNPKSKSKPKYFEVPIEIVEDRDALKVWATKAYEVAKKAKK